MKAEELNQKTDNELTSLLTERKIELSKLRFKLAQGSLKSVRNFRNIRKDIARILTILNIKDNNK